MTNYSKDTLSFFQVAYQVVRLIPEGRVTSYGAIAKAIGTGKSSRMVGWAMANSYKEKDAVPAHRVVNRIGLLTGKMHFTPPSKMEELLKKEGIEVKNDKVINFKKHFWNPLEEL